MHGERVPETRRALHQRSSMRNTTLDYKEEGHAAVYTPTRSLHVIANIISPDLHHVVTWHLPDNMHTFVVLLCACTQSLLQGRDRCCRNMIIWCPIQRVERARITRRGVLLSTRPPLQGIMGIFSPAYPLSRYASAEPPLHVFPAP